MCRRAEVVFPSGHRGRRLTCEMLGELLLQLGGSVEGFASLLLRQTLVHLPAARKQDRQQENQTSQPDRKWNRGGFDSHDVLHWFGFDEDGDGVKLRELESLDGVPRHVQDTVFTLKRAESVFNLSLCSERRLTSPPQEGSGRIYLVIVFIYSLWFKPRLSAAKRINLLFILILTALREPAGGICF